MSEEDGVPSLVPQWTMAMDDLTSALERLRRIYPSRMMLLPETGHRAIREAMNGAQDSVAALHRAGRYVLGADGYEDYLAEKIADDL